MTTTDIINLDTTTTSIPALPPVDESRFTVHNGVVIPTQTGRVSQRSSYGSHRVTHVADERGLDRDTLRQYVGSVFAETPQPGRTTDRYRFSSSATVLDQLQAAGWRVTYAGQNRVRKADRNGYQRHLLRLAHPDAPVTADGDRPEILYSNSHDATTVERLDLGFFRAVCANGIVVGSAAFGSITLPHRASLRDVNVADYAGQLLGRVPQLVSAIDTFRGTTLSPERQLEFAQRAFLLRWENDSTAPVHPESLLVSRRHADADASLWTAFNRVQENLIRGGIEDGRRTGSGRARSVRRITSVAETVAVNRQLWDLAESFAN